MTIHELAKMADTTLEIGLTTGQNDFFVNLIAVRIKEGPVLRSAIGFGTTIEIATDRLCESISNQQIVVGAGTKDRRVFHTPIISPYER